MMRLIKGLLCFAAVFGAMGAAKAMALDVSARSAILIEADTGKVLYAQNAHEQLPMASTTKIMTALVALENGDISDMVTVDASAYGMEGSSIYLDLEEEISLNDLLYGLMLSSGNDAAVAIAVHIGGGIGAFADMMNKKALELGAYNTNFVTPNGLHDDQHYTTAYDLARIAAAAMKNPSFREIVSTEYYRAETGERARTFKNKNRILWEYPGGTGVKTGYTKAAGRCLVFSAEQEGMGLIGVVLNCPDMFEDAEKILDYGFENYETVIMVKAGVTAATVSVNGGEKSLLELTPAQDIIVPVEKGGSASYRTRVVTDETISAPVYAGDVLGYIEVLDGDALLLRRDLIAGEDIPDAGIDYYFRRIIKRFAA